MSATGANSRIAFLLSARAYLDALMPVLRCLGLLTLLAAILAGCTRKPELHRFSGHFKGLHYHIQWWASGSVNATALDKRVQKTLSDTQRQISLSNPGSALVAFNRSKSTQWQPMPHDLISLLEIAKIVHTLSRGCYDPTIKPLIDLWGFRDDILHVPDANEIADARARIGLERLDIDKLRGRIRKTVPGLALDLSAIANGYGLWRLSKTFDRAGVDNYLIHLDGDLMAKGHRVDGKRWRVHVHHALPGKGSVVKRISVDDEDGVAIDSATTRHHFKSANGHAYSRIINPHTGAPVRHNLVAATVFGSDPRMADAWSSAMLCLGKKPGEAVAERLDLRVLFVRQEQNYLLESESPALRSTREVTVY